MWKTRIMLCCYMVPGVLDRSYRGIFGTLHPGPWCSRTQCYQPPFCVQPGKHASAYIVAQGIKRYQVTSG